MESNFLNRDFTQADLSHNPTQRDIKDKKYYEQFKSSIVNHNKETKQDLRRPPQQTSKYHTPDPRLLNVQSQNTSYPDYNPQAAYIPEQRYPQLRSGQDEFVGQNNCFAETSSIRMMRLGSRKTNTQRSISDFNFNTSYESENDEDYSYIADLELNKRILQEDERYMNLSIPKSEVEDLLAEQFIPIGGLEELQQPLNTRKRLNPDFNQQMNGFPANKRMKTAGTQHGMLDLFDSQEPSSQYVPTGALTPGGSQVLRPNYNNNYYYNFNNNYCPNPHADQPDHNSQKMVKSQEVQVSPEKLEEAGTPDFDNKSKKKRRRKRQAKVAEQQSPDKLPYANLWPNQPQYPYMQPNMPMSYMCPPRYPYYGGYMPTHQLPPQYQYNPGFLPSMNGTKQDPSQFDEGKSKEHMRDYLRTMFYPFSNEQLKELVQQIDIYIQMLYQVLFLTKSQQEDPVDQATQSKAQQLAQDQLKYRTYCLLYDFMSKKEQTLKPLDLPSYKIPWVKTLKDEALEMPPQVSFYQSPLLEFASDIIERLSDQNDKQLKPVKFLNKFSPLINQQLLPIKKTASVKAQNSVEQCSQQSQDTLPGPIQPNGMNNNRRKFSHVDDNFLLLGLRQYGYKEIELIRSNWLPNKTQNEIKHRYKNMTCAKAPDNQIKSWKENHNKPLSPSEQKQLAQAIQWFGADTNRWTLISRCFLPNRSPHFLKMEYQSIVQDNAKAERFGQMMLSEDEEEKGFEDIDLDREDSEEISKSNSLNELLNGMDDRQESESSDREAAEDDANEGVYEEVDL